MELYQLRTFIAVAQQGHLTQAAELLHLSQPAVTAQIKALQEELGVLLFERYPGGVQLTEAAKTLLPDAEQILASSRAMLNRAKALASEPKGKVRIGTIGVPARLKLGPWLACLKMRYPLLAVQTLHGISGSVLNEVRKKTLDGGFYLGRNPYQSVNTIPLADVRFCVALPPQWRVQLEKSNWRELGKMPWLGVSQFSSLSGITQDVWRMHNIAPRKVGESDEEAVLIELVKSGLGVALLAERTAHRFAADGSIALWQGGEAVISAPLQFIYSADRDEDPLLAMLRETLFEVWRLADD